ncbi:5930_t:CDS:2, partial [Cetraspora pellucida]
MGEEIKKLTPKDGSEDNVIFHYDWVKNPEAQSKGGNFIYIHIDNSNDDESIVDLTHNDNDINDDGDDSNGNDGDNGESSDDNDGGSEN